MSSDAGGWRGLAADLLAADGEAISASPLSTQPTPTLGDVPTERCTDGAVPARRRRRNGGESFASANQLVGLWFPHDMARELRSRAETAGLSNSEFVREILREHFNRSQ
jgi:hypothetical protein